MPIIDPEFGELIVSKTGRTGAVKFQVTPAGRLKVTAPKYMPNFIIKNIIDTERESLKKSLDLDGRKPVAQKDIEKRRREARKVLTVKIHSLARTHGFKFERLRFSTATTRWGSCSSTGTISLNIALMSLPDHLVEYVLLHELTHTEHMNHSKDFWNRLEQVCPGAKNHKKQIAKHHPSL